MPSGRARFAELISGCAGLKIRSAYSRSSRHSRVAACRINGLINGAARSACANPGRSECAITASSTAVRGQSVGARTHRRGMGFDHAARPSPSTMRITIVRGSGLVNSATTGTPNLPIRNVTATRNRSDSSGRSSSAGGDVSTSSRVNEYG